MPGATGHRTAWFLPRWHRLCLAAPFVRRRPCEFATSARMAGACIALLRRRAVVELQYVEKLAQPLLLIADEVPRLRQHPLHHDLGLAPVAVEARADEVLARPRPRAMPGDDFRNYG